MTTQPVKPALPRRDDPALHDRSHGVRLHKALADAGVGSRRACEQLIAEQRVAVNGQTVVQMPVWVDPAADRIEVDGRAIRVKAPRRRPLVYLMLNKPRSVLCTNSDPEGRRTVLDLLPHKDRLFCVGRLDNDSSGLVLMTNDGELANRLTHPRYEIPKTYRVSIRGRLEDDQIAKLQRGVYLADKQGGRAVKAKAAAVEIVKRDRERTSLRITLREGRNREIRRMMARLGHHVHRLRREAIGPLRLKGVAVGEWRELTRIEIQALRRAARGLKTADPVRSRRSPAQRAR